MKTAILYLAVFLIGSILTLGARESVLSEIQRAHQIEQEFRGIRAWVDRLERQQGIIRELALMKQQPKKGKGKK